MKFIKLNQNTMRCVLTEADMNAHGVHMSDFLEHNDTARQMIDFLLAKGVEEIGYQRTGEMISINVTPLPENSIALTFSDASNELREMIKHLVDVAKKLNLDKLAQEGNKSMKDAILDRGLEKISSMATLKDNRVFEFDYFALKFKSLKNVIDYCKKLILEDNKILVISNLYRSFDGGYYLTMIRGAQEQRKFQYMGVLALEFASLESSNEIYELGIKEHNNLIIADNAIEILRNI